MAFRRENRSSKDFYAGEAWNPANPTRTGEAANENLTVSAETGNELWVDDSVRDLPLDDEEAARLLKAEEEAAKQAEGEEAAEEPTGKAEEAAEEAAKQAEEDTAGENASLQEESEMESGKADQAAAAGKVDDAETENVAEADTGRADASQKEDSALNNMQTADDPDFEDQDADDLDDYYGQEQVPEKRQPRYRGTKPRRGPMIAIVVLIIIAAVLAATLVYSMKKQGDLSPVLTTADKQDEEGLIIDENISALVTNYLFARANGETDIIETYAAPMTDAEKELIGLENKYVTEYRDIVCSRADGPDENSWWVTVTDNRVYKKAKALHPEVSILLVRKNESGLYLIDNAYGAFNRTTGLSDADPQLLEAAEALVESDPVSKLLDQAEAVQAESAKDADYAKAEQGLYKAAKKWIKKNPDQLEGTSAKAKDIIEAVTGISADDIRQYEDAEAAKQAAEAQAQGQADAADTDNAGDAAQGQTDAASGDQAGAGQSEDGTADTDNAGDAAQGQTDPASGDQAGTDQSEDGTADQDSQQEAAWEEPTADNDVPGHVYVRTALRIRNTESMDADWDKTVYPGDELEVIAYRNGWYHVRSGDTEGYVKEDYVKRNWD